MSESALSFLSLVLLVIWLGIMSVVTRNIKGDEVRMQMVIVDSHKEVLPYWFKEYLKIKRPFVIVRIDKHHDMNHDCPAFPATEGRQALNYLAKMMLYIL